jgi:hypothetical protein
VYVPTCEGVHTMLAANILQNRFVLPFPELVFTARPLLVCETYIGKPFGTRVVPQCGTTCESMKYRGDDDVACGMFPPH